MWSASRGEGTEEDEERVRKEEGEVRGGGIGGERKEWGRIKIIKIFIYQMWKMRQMKVKQRKKGVGRLLFLVISIKWLIIYSKVKF